MSVVPVHMGVTGCVAFAESSMIFVKRRGRANQMPYRPNRHCLPTHAWTSDSGTVPGPAGDGSSVPPSPANPDLFTAVR